MDHWGWAIAGAVLFITVVQLVAYFYLMRGNSSSGVLPSSTDGARPNPGVGSPEPPTEDGHSEEQVRRCNRCGAPNDNEPIFTYCRNCGAQLS